MSMDLFDQVKRLLPEDYAVRPKLLTHAVFALLADHLARDEAGALEEGLATLLPADLGSLLHRSAAKADRTRTESHLSRDEFLEALASRPDIDDEDAEVGACAVLVTLRKW